ncbi:uncharacterized protein LOC108632933 isoform X2 [Ceratina calcarata]|uniref:Uncharacterized protein LOC108632933 isoform X2 n=1 Tax=Ceratina calcarata TaxID=156304 RepID=A0AAJ7NG05_9HYME|nr:uncharacterized protein LOC108632933 isoform X2 [Ceratina calcarata]
MDSDGDKNAVCQPPPAKKQRKQEFRDAWLQDDSFKPWLERCEDDPYKARCNFCNKKLGVGRCNLLKHKDSVQHAINTGRAQGEVSELANYSVKKAEIRFSLDVVEHNRSFHSYNHFVKMLKQAIPDSEIMKNVSLGRGKMTGIVKNVINKAIILKNMAAMKDKFFSILLDESTDVSNTRHLCILARYVNKGKINTYVLDYLHIKDGTAENLYKCLMYALETHNLNVNNIVGVCADNASIIVGKNNSVLSRLLENNKEIAVFPRVCHSIHIIAYEATKCLPSYVESFLHKIHTYFTKNPRKQVNGQRIMKKIVQPSPTRWLALTEYIKSILIQWDLLHTLFEKTVSEAESNLARDILDRLNCKLTKAYLQFLSRMLSVTAKFNVIFQSPKIPLHCLLIECNRYLRYIGNNFIKSNVIETEVLHEIDIVSERNLLPVDNIIVDSETRKSIQKLKNTQNAEEIKEFFGCIKKFYQTLYAGAIERLPFTETFSQSFDFLDPSTTLYIPNHQDQLDRIIDKFPSKFDRQLVKTEWQDMAMHFSPEEKKELAQLDITEFWYRMSQIKDCNDSYLYSNVVKLAELCLSLPHLNADVEKFFSVIIEIKRKDRNRMNTNMICALTRIKIDFKNENKNCETFEITTEMLDLFNSKMYHKDVVPKQLEEIIVLEENLDKSSNKEDN